MSANSFKTIRIRSIFTLFIWLVASFFLIHFFALFGVILAAAYPILWLLFPEQTTCFSCRTTKEGEMCSLCRRKVNKERGIFPKTFTSAFLNACVILALSVMSLGFVWGERYVLKKLGYPPTEKTVTFVIPSKGQSRIGEIFPVKIEIVGVETPINAVQADLSFDTDRLEIVDFSTEDSFANIFIQKELNNEHGYARLSGGLPNPGFFGDHGVFGIAFFKGKVAGLTKIEYLPTSLVLANDTKGTNVLKDLAEVAHLVLPEKISEEEEELQRSITMKTSVLGESTEAAQMKFFTDTPFLRYEEESQVLGRQEKNEETQPEVVEEEQHFLRKILTILGKVDNFIIEQWSKVFMDNADE